MSHTHPHHPEPGADRIVADASVRVARPSDAPAVGFVQAVLWRDAYARVLPPQVVETFQPAPFTNAWRASLEQPPSAAYRLLVACAGEQVVGFAAVGPSSDQDARDGDGELLVLGVHPEGRHAGHGSRLLNAAVDTARGAGFTTLHAWLLADDEVTRAFLGAGGLLADGAYRDRVVGPADEDTAREVRVSGAIA
ncbi:MAG: GNAT family N-acetyltransferase [Lapillicoccus sp.]